MKLKAIAICLSIALQGCTVFDHKYNQDNVLSETGSPTTPEQMKSSGYMKYDNAYLGKKVDYNSKKQALLRKHVKIQSYEQTDLMTVLEAVSAQTGTSYRINTAPSGGKASNDTVGEDTHSVSFEGTFEEFVNYISTLYDVNPVLDDNGILKVSYFENYVIRLDFYGENNKFEASLDLSGNQATSGGGLKGKTEQKFESSFWDDVEDMAGKYITSGVYSIFKDASIITLNARPSEYKALNEVLKKYQADNSRQFVLTYKIFTLDKSKTKEFGAGVNVNFNDGTTSIGIDSNDMLAKLSGGLTTGWKNSHLDVTSQLDALYELTGSKVLQSGSFITRNNVPIPLNLTNSQYYVSSRTREENSTTGNVDTAVETSELVTGTSFIITPRILTDGRIEVASGFTKRFLNSIDVFDNVQLPSVSTTETFNVSTITPGSLLMVSKYEAKEDSDGRTFSIMGGNYTSGDNIDTVVMVVGIDNYRAPTYTR
ncbi:type II and III secretion system protein [Superficieibacter sp.]|uniref:type II and III secretion system protein n=1 Tax=Superficieibacter sp. TaxID=2303322 RepID=UPI0028A66C2E|nr:type II and III secretion system protein [Superficieibacter sp.]